MMMGPGCNGPTGRQRKDQARPDDSGGVCCSSLRHSSFELAATGYIEWNKELPMQQEYRRQVCLETVEKNSGGCSRRPIVIDGA